MKKVIGLMIGLVPLSVSAECVPSPDCASIGYTETSCDGDSLKCPFDSSKLKCFPCDSSFRYSCTGENITGGIGNTCNGKYVDCECKERTIFTNGKCVCDTSCDVVGNIVYSDRSCSSCNLTDKIPVAIVAHKDENKRLIIPLNTPYKRWSSYNADVTILENLETAEIAKLDMDGANNSQRIRELFASDNETNNAAWYCYNLELEGFEEYKNQWYLPAAWELYNYYYGNITSIKKAFSTLGITTYNTCFWSSSENNIHRAWSVWSDDGGLRLDGKNGSYKTTCFLAI